MKRYLKQKAKNKTHQGLESGDVDVTFSFLPTRCLTLSKSPNALGLCFSSLQQGD